MGRMDERKSQNRVGRDVVSPSPAVGSTPSMPETRPTSIRLSDDLRALMDEVRPGAPMATFIREAVTFYVGYLAATVDGRPTGEVESIMRRVWEDIE